MLLRRIGLVAVASVALGCNAVLGIESGRVGETTATASASSSGGPGGTGGAATSTSSGSGTAGSGGGGPCPAERLPDCHPGAGGGAPCDPIQLTAPDDSYTLGMVMVGDFLHFAGGDGQIHRIRYDGVPDSTFGNGSDSVFVAVDATRIYWTDWYDGVIRAATIEAPHTLADVTEIPGTPHIGRIALHDGILYIVGESPNAIWMAAADGSEPNATQVATKAEATDVDPASGIAVDDTHVYWTDGNQVRRIPIAEAGNAQAIEDFEIAPGGGDLALDADYVYWGSEDGLSWKPKAGGPTTTIPVADTRARAVLLDGNYVYVTTPDGRILRVPKGGGAADLVTVTHGEAWGYQMAADCGAIYWGTFVLGATGTVFKVKKP